jgi:hypothetical protein
METAKKLKLGAIMNKNVSPKETTPKVEVSQEADTQVPQVSTPVQVPDNKMETYEKENTPGIQENQNTQPVDISKDNMPAIGIHKDNQNWALNDKHSSVDEKEKKEKEAILEKLKKVENVGISKENENSEKKLTEKKELFTSYQAELYKNEDEALEESELKKHPIKKEEPKPEITKEIDTPLTTDKQENSEVSSAGKNIETKNTWDYMKKKENKDIMKQKWEEQEGKWEKKKKKRPLKMLLTSIITLASLGVIVWWVFFVDTGSDFIENYKTSILDMVNKDVSEQNEDIVENQAEEVDTQVDDTNSWTSQNWDIETIVFWRTSEDVKVIDNNWIKEFEYNWEIYESKETVYNVIRITTIKRVILDYFKILR